MGLETGRVNGSNQKYKTEALGITGILDFVHHPESKN
jgi:hypothetical protein